MGSYLPDEQAELQDKATTLLVPTYLESRNLNVESAELSNRIGNTSDLSTLPESLGWGQWMTPRNAEFCYIRPPLSDYNLS